MSPDRYSKAPVVSATPAPACEGPPKKFMFSSMLAFLVNCLRVVFRVQSTGLDPARDELEFELLAEVEEQGKPILGICRGEQLMNVHRGGSLHTELSAFYVQEANPRSIRPVKKVSVKSKSRLHEILSADDCTVNSLHNQAVADLGDGVQVSAVEPSGVVQAIEKAPGFWLGVQWHPEYMPQSKPQRQLFRSLVFSASEVSASESSVADSGEPG